MLEGRKAIKLAGLCNCEMHFVRFKKEQNGMGREERKQTSGNCSHHIKHERCAVVGSH